LETLKLFLRLKAVHNKPLQDGALYPLLKRKKKFCRETRKPSPRILKKYLRQGWRSCSAKIIFAAKMGYNKPS